MTGKPVTTDAIRSARRRSARPATRTLTRVGLMALPGAAVLAATAPQAAGALATAKHEHQEHTATRLHKESPLVAMRRILEEHTAATTTTTATTVPPPVPPPPTPTTIATPPVAAVAAAPVPRARPVAPAPAPAPAPHPAPHPAPPPPAPVHTAGIVPPGNPPASMAPNPNFESICTTDGPLSALCIASTLQATDAARAREGLGQMSLPGNYSSLTAAEQLFVLADIERVDRGLPPAAGLVNEFDQDAQAAAQADADPTPSAVPPGVGILRWASNWGENAGALGSNYGWMYDDGPGSGNEACGSGGGGCWGHRDNILGFNAAQLAGATLVMGAGEAEPPAASPWMSDTELFAVITGHPAFYAYTWAQAVEAGAH